MPSPSVDVLTACCNPEMEPWCKGMFERQDYDGEINHLMSVVDCPGSNRGRWAALGMLLIESTADYFLMADDDDYVNPEFVRHCVASATGRRWYGEIPSRLYNLRVPGWSEGTGRRKLFTTFVLWHRSMKSHVLGALLGRDPSETMRPWLAKPKPTYATHLVVLRGMMDDPSQAVTKAKNADNPDIWPNKDPDYSKLREWVDEAAFDELMDRVLSWSVA